MSENGVLR